MKKNLIGLAAIVLLSGSAHAAGFDTDKGSKPQVVESYSASTTIIFDTATSGQIVVDKLKFEEGSTYFDGELVDLSGSEADYAGMTASFSSDNASFADSAMHVGQGSTSLDSGESGTATFSGSGAFDLGQLQVGDTFVGAGTFANISGSDSSLSSSKLTYSSTYTITKVDVANGLVRASCSGDVSAEH